MRLHFYTWEPQGMNSFSDLRCRPYATVTTCSFVYIRRGELRTIGSLQTGSPSPNPNIDFHKKWTRHINSSIQYGPYFRRDYVRNTVFVNMEKENGIQALDRILSALHGMLLYTRTYILNKDQEHVVSTICWYYAHWWYSPLACWHVMPRRYHLYLWYITLQPL